MAIQRTVIGSFPRLHEDDVKAIDSAVALQRKYGIDLLSDGEQRGDMIIYLARAIPGLGVEGNYPVVSGKVRPPEDPLKIHKVADYFMLRDRYPDIRFKVTLTGPTTLALSCGSKKLSKDYKSYVDIDLTKDIAEALRTIVKPLFNAKVHIQIDEPILSQGFRDVAERIRLIDYVLEGSDPSLCSTHICGWLGRQPILDELVKLENLTVLSHAFSALEETKNIDLLRRGILEDNDKKLGAGITSVAPLSLRHVDASKAVSERLSKIEKIVGRENIAFVHPDCGLGATRKDFVEPILKAFFEGTKSIY